MSITCIMRRTLPGVVGGGLLALLATVSPVRAADDGPIKIGVISEQSAIVGQAISQGAQIAADDINARAASTAARSRSSPTTTIPPPPTRCAPSSARCSRTTSPRWSTTFISEVALAIEPWAARLHMPTITPAAASNLISKQVHDKYAQYKYMFEGWLPSPILAQAVCDASHDIFAVGAAHEDRGDHERGRRLDHAAR